MLALMRAGLRDDRHEHGLIASEEGAQPIADAIEQVPARDDAVLHDFVEPRAELAARQRREQRRIDRDGRGRVERADQILAQRVVDADLPSHGAIHLRQKRRRHLHNRDAPQVRGGREPGDVADDAAADGDDRRGAVGRGADQRVVDAPHGPQVLVTFAVRNEDRLLARDAAEVLGVQAPDSRARDDEPPGREPRLLEDGVHARCGARRDLDGVVPGGRAHVEPDGAGRRGDGDVHRWRW